MRHESQLVCYHIQVICTLNLPYTKYCVQEESALQSDILSCKRNGEVSSSNLQLMNCFRCFENGRLELD